jgi:hypothetical protein
MVNVNWQVGITQRVTLQQNENITFSNGVSGNKYFLLLTVTGEYSASWAENVIWPDDIPPTQTSETTKTDVFVFVYDGSCYHGKIYGLDYPPYVI